ncbi:Thymidylate kinase [compost metagenome]
MSEVKLGHMVAIEGNNGVGKSTQVELVAARLRAAGHDVVVVREPGGSALGERLRTVLKDQREIKLNNTTELLLFAAQRDDMYRTVVRPALDAGKVVLADRSYFSTFAHQIHPFIGQNGILLQVFNLVTSMNIGHLGGTPVIVINLAMDEALRQERLASIEKREEDAFEDHPAEILKLVDDAYGLLAQQPGVTTFDATREVEELADAIFDQVQVSINQRVQEAAIMAEQQAAHAAAEPGTVDGNAAEAEEPAAPEPVDIAVIEAEINDNITHHISNLVGMFPGDFSQHQVQFDTHVASLRKWVAIHMDELRLRAEPMFPQEAQHRTQQIVGNIGTMLGGFLTLINIGEMVANADKLAAELKVRQEAELNEVAPELVDAAPAEVSDAEVAERLRGQTPHVAHVDEAGLVGDESDAVGVANEAAGAAEPAYEGVEGRNEAPGQ